MTFGTVIPASRSWFRAVTRISDVHRCRAELAIAAFERSAAGAIVAEATALPRLDAIVFTGAIGKHAPTVRRGIVRHLASIGVPPLEDASAVSDGALVAAPIAVLVVAAREDVVIAREVIAVRG